MRTVAVFQSTLFDYAKTFSGEPPGRDCAQYVMELLAIHEVSFTNSQPIAGDFGWFLYPKMEGTEYEVIVHWAVPQDRNEDFWCLTVGIRRGIFKRLLDREPSEAQLERFCCLVNEALSSDQRQGRISNLSWFTMEDFSRSYVC